MNMMNDSCILLILERDNVCEITFIHTRKKEGKKYTCKKEINFIILLLIMDDNDGN